MPGHARELSMTVVMATACVAMTGCQQAKVVMDKVEVGATAVWHDTMEGARKLTGDSYLNDESDACIAERRTLDEHGEVFDRAYIGAAVAGAAAGGITGFVRTRSLKGVLVGAGIGAGIGLASTYLIKLQEEERLKSGQIATRAINDVRNENEKIDALLVAFERLVACRKREAGVILADLRASRIDRAEATTRMQDVKKRYREDVERAQDVAKTISENSEGYATVYNQIAADNDSDAIEVTEYKPSAGGGRTRSANVVRGKGERPIKSDTVKPIKLAKEEKGKVNTLQKECLTNVNKRDSCFDAVQTAKKQEDEITEIPA